MRPIKVFSLICALLFLSACSTLRSGQDVASASAADIAQTRTAELEVELVRLKSENARLANQLLALKRENEHLETQQTVAEADGAADVTLPDVALPPAPAFKDAALVSNRTAVLDGPNAPEIAKTDIPVEPAPRLVQPTFASTDSVFENEAEGDFETQSVLFGVHLASYRKVTEARDGWRQLQRENPDELGLLEPRIETVTIPDKGVFMRLIGGGFSSKEKAAALCASLKNKKIYCMVSGFEGQRLSIGGAG